MDRRIIAVALTLILCASTAWGRMNALVVGGVGQSSNKSDDFERTDGALGGDWLAASSALTNLTISSGAVSTTGDWVTGGGRYSTSTSDKSVIMQDGNTAAAELHTCVRMGASSDGYCAKLKTPTGGNWTGWEIQKNGSYLCEGGSISYAQNASHTMSISASGTSTVTLTMVVDSATITSSCTDSSSTITSGNPGIKITAYGATRGKINSWQDF